jgi:2-methylcitrate dehydratase PrpD
MSKKSKSNPKTTVSPLMKTLATYMANAAKKPLPKHVAEKTKHHVLDTIAAMVSGSRLLPGTKAIAYAKTLGGAPQSLVIGSKIITNAEQAAHINGMLAHADETDDSHAASLSHPGCAIVPAALAMGEREKSNGTQLLRAVALGYDLCARLNLSLHPYDFRQAGHSTHSFGPGFGAAAAASLLAGLDYNGMRHALSYTAQQCSGISCWMRDEEHIEKAFDFGGMPARNGTAAASMVASGFTAVEDVFSGERNFYVAYDETRRIGLKPQPQRLIKDLGKVYEIMNTNIMCAVMLIDGIVTFKSSHDEKRMNDKKVLDLRKRITLLGDDALTAALPSRQGILELKLKGGKTLHKHVKAVLGTAQNPMTRAQVDEKCYHLMAPILGASRSRKLCDAVWNIEKVGNITKLRNLLTT